MTASPFSTLVVGPKVIPNRLALAPVKTALGGKDGRASPRHVAYYRRRAQGGAGWIIVEPLFVVPEGREHPRQLGAHEDDVVEGLRRIVDAVHECGSLVFAHLNHAGRAANPQAIGGIPEAPSPVPCPTTGATPSELTAARIEELIRAYAAAAGRAREAGFDGVELQLGLGYLPAQFLSPRTNRREDAYGCAGEGRWRFVDELVTAVPGLHDPLTAEQVLTGRKQAGRRVLIVGGGLVGIEMAEHLALREREVVVVELLADIARDMEAITRKMTLKRLEGLSVRIHKNARFLRLEDGEAHVAIGDTGKEVSLGRFDSVLVSVGHRPHDPLSAELRSAGIPVEVLGDAREPRQIFDATQAGRRAFAVAAPEKA